MKGVWGKLSTESFPQAIEGVSFPRPLPWGRFPGGSGRKGVKRSRLARSEPPGDRCIYEYRGLGETRARDEADRSAADGGPDKKREPPRRYGGEALFLLFRAGPLPAATFSSGRGRRPPSLFSLLSGNAALSGPHRLTPRRSRTGGLTHRLTVRLRAGVTAGPHPRQAALRSFSSFATVTCTLRGSAAPLAGMVISSTPPLYSAWTFSVSTPSGRVMVRSKLP